MIKFQNPPFTGGIIKAEVSSQCWPINVTGASLVHKDKGL